MATRVCELILACLEINGGSLKQTISGFSYKGEPKGDWEIIVKQKK